MLPSVDNWANPSRSVEIALLRILMASPFWLPIQLAKNHHYEFTSSVAAIKTDESDADGMARIREIPLRNFALEIFY
jgi:hypothetical protein